MESYLIFLALVFCNVGAGLCGAIDQPGPNDPYEAETLFEEFHDLKGRQLLYMAHVDEVMKTMTAMTERLAYLEDSQSDYDTDSASDESGESAGSGAVYIRWGRKTCPEGTQLVYTGYAAGSHYSHSGAAVNHLCLTTEPKWFDFTDAFEAGTAYLYGAEYEFKSHPEWDAADLHDHDVPCAVCQAPRSSVMMIPGTYDCLEDWTLEYGGYLIASHYKHNAATEYICMDGKPEALHGGGPRDDNGVLFYFVQAQCTSLKCPPYEPGREVTCAICTR